MNIVVTVNGPGEIAGWLRPLAAVLARSAPHISLTTVVTPCQYASGRESECLASVDGVSHVERLGPYLRRTARTWFGGRADRHPRLVLHLGGDPLYAIVLARLAHADAWTYGTSGRYRRAFGRFLVPDERTAQKLRRQTIAADRIDIVGQLVADSVSDGRQPRVGTDHAEPTVVFLAGSRDAYVDVMTPYFTAVVERLHHVGVRIRAVMLVSPFVSVERVVSRLGEAGWSVVRTDGPIEATSPNGPTLRVVPGGLADLDAADLVVTIPGTNTLQLAALGMPHVVVTPGHQAEQIVFVGPFGLLKPHWWGAAAIRRAAVHRISRSRPFLALPNIIAGEAIVPEMRGAIEPADVAATVVSLLNAPDERRTMSERLRIVAGPPGAAARLVELMLAQYQPSCASAL